MIPAVSRPATELYTDGEYARKYPDWHVNDAPNKAADLFPGLLAIADDTSSTKLRVADVGAGVGGVIVNLKERFEAARPGRSMEMVAFEIAPQCVQRARELFPDLEMRQKLLEVSDGPFDAIILADVLEHVENPWELLRIARAASTHLLVRQPLLESFSTFRHDNYGGQMREWGHITFFNIRSFLEICRATGWQPLKAELTAPWELAGGPGRGGVLHSMLVRLNRTLSSYFLSGFYLNGAFKHGSVGNH